MIAIPGSLSKIRRMAHHLFYGSFDRKLGFLVLCETCQIHALRKAHFNILDRKDDILEPGLYLKLHKVSPCRGRSIEAGMDY